MSEMEIRHRIAGALLLSVVLALVMVGVAVAQGPEIVDVEAANICDTTATITWTTCESANSTVTYGDTTPPTQTQTKSGNYTSHSIGLAGLNPDTLYYYSVSSTGADGNTTVDDRCSQYYTFTTFSDTLSLDGWGWCTDYAEVVEAELDGCVAIVQRAQAPETYSLHVTGNLTLHRSGGPEVIPIDAYGSRVRSLFYLRQEITGKSASFEGTWMDAAGGQYYIMCTGAVGLPNPGGQSLKTARICFVVLRTPDVEVAIADSGTFVEDIESMATRFVKFIDGVLDSLLGTGFREILSNILEKLAAFVAALRNLGAPYVQ